jgi:hypothetical protein
MVSMLLSYILKRPIDRLRVFVPPSPLDIVHAQYPMDMICLMSFNFFPNIPAPPLDLVHALFSIYTT